jgi:hypothetical protein
MTNRTIQFFGKGYGTVPINATVQISGNVVFTGEIPTVDQPLSVLSLDQVKIFEFELPLDTVGPVPASISFTGAETVYVEQVQGNYLVYVPNPVFTPEELAIIQNPDTTQADKVPIYERVANPPLTAEDIFVIENGTRPEVIVVLEQHNLELRIFVPEQFTTLTEPQIKFNVKINNIVVERLPEPPGEWGWEVPLINGTGTMTFDLNLPPPVEII